MSNRNAANDPDFRDAVFNELSAAADELNPEEHLAFAMALSVALCERIGNRREIMAAIADAKGSLKSNR